MPRRIRVFGPESGAEGIHVSERKREDLGLELAADGQAGRQPEKIFCKVDPAAFVSRHVFRVQRGDTEHGAGSLAIARGNDRRMDIIKTMFVEITVSRETQRTPYARDRAERVGARPQMCDLAQVLEGVALFLQRIVRLRIAMHGKGTGMHLKMLSLSR